MAKNKKSKKTKPIVERVLKICPICEKPHKMRTQCCVKCNRELLDIQKIVEPRSKYRKASINKVVNIKQKYKSIDVFSLIKSNPEVWYTLDHSSKRKEEKRNIREHQRSDDYRKQEYQKWEGEIPMYIYNLMKNHYNKQLLTLSGDKLNPNIHYFCLSCGEEQMQTYKSMVANKGHNCTSIKSSGESIIENYLKSFTKIKTQYDTFKCINPLTGRQLPYDIEVVGKKVLIEIQGEQHLKYIEYFHGTIENFHYQQRKDSYKKRYAESKGYKLIYILYDDFKSGEYKNKLSF